MCNTVAIRLTMASVRGQIQTGKKKKSHSVKQLLDQSSRF